MDAVTTKLLIKQWKTLHNSHESYEHYALMIKLVSVTLVLASIALSVNTVAVLLLLLILWLQEGIWKTFQKRTENSILAIEDQLETKEVESLNQPNSPYLFYKHWQTNRPATKGLVTEYITSALKPTVLYPYIPLMLLVIVF